MINTLFIIWLIVFVSLYVYVTYGAYNDKEIQEWDLKKFGKFWAFVTVILLLWPLTGLITLIDEL